MGFTVYYDDGTLFRDADGEPGQAPAWGVQAVCQDDGDDRVVVAGDDFYFYDPTQKRWFGVDLIGLVDVLTHGGFLKVGRFIAHSRYAEILSQATAEAEGTLTWVRDESTGEWLAAR